MKELAGLLPDLAAKGCSLTENTPEQSYHGLYSFHKYQSAASVSWMVRVELAIMVVLAGRRSECRSQAISFGLRICKGRSGG